MKRLALFFILPVLLVTGCLGGAVPPNVVAVKARGNVAYQAQATASSTYTDPFWGLNFAPSAAVDGLTVESHQPETFWLLPNATTGFLSIDPDGIVEIERIRILNTHNSGFNDRGSKDFRVDVVNRDGNTTTVWRDRFPAIGGAWKEKTLDGVIADRIIIHVDSYYSNGGGLNEVEIIGSKAPPPSLATRAPSVSFPEEPVEIAYARAPSRPEDIAVIIGNADYGVAGKDIPNVVPAHADAEGFRRYARLALGIQQDNIIFIRDATQAKLVSVFGSRDNAKGQLYNWVEPGESRVYVYYSGHGAPGGSDGSAYLVPTDANAATLELNGYPLATLYANLSKIPAKSVTVVLEACFSGASEGGAVISNASPVFSKAKSVPAPNNITVIAAGAANQIASWEKDKSHGLFTKYYLLGMAGAADKAPYGNGDGAVGYAELKRYFKKTVTKFARRYYSREQEVQIMVGASR